MFNALLWNLLLTTAAAILLAAVCRFPAMSRRPALRHALWLLLLAKLVTPPLVSVPLLPAPRHDVAATAAPSIALTGYERSELDHDLQGDSAVHHATSYLIGEGASRDARGVTSPGLRSGGRVPYLPGLLAISLVGTCLLLTVHGIHAAKLCRWLKRAGTENSWLAQTCSDVASRLGIRSVVRSCVVDARTAPLLWGWRRPMVVLPRQLMDDLGPQQLRSIVAHELAHYLRRDHWANMFAFLVKVLMWWDPVVWWAHREVRAAQELCCDAITIERCSTNRRCYATTLLTALEFVQAEPLAQREFALGIGSRKSVLRRFEMIGDQRLSYRLSLWTLLILLISGIPLVCFPVRGQEHGTPAVTTPDPSDAGVATDSEDVRSESLGEGDETELPAEIRPDRLFLVGIVSQRSASDTESMPTAWLFDREGRARTVVRKGTAFTVGDTSATVEDIQEDAVLVKVNEKLRRWKLGMSLAALLSEETGPRGLAEDEAAEAPAKAKTPDGATGLDVRMEPLDGPVQIELLDDSKVMILRGKDKDVKRVADLIRQIDQRRPKSAPSREDGEEVGEAGQAPQLEVYSLSHGEVDPQTVVLLLKTLLAGRPEVRLDADPKTRNLIVLAPPNDHATVRAALEKLLSKPASAAPDVARKERVEKKRPEETGDRPVPRLVYLRYAQAEQVAKVVREVFQGTRTDMSVESLAGINAIIVVAPDALFWEVKELAEALDRAMTESNQTILKVPWTQKGAFQSEIESIEKGMKAHELERSESIEKGMKASELEHRQRWIRGLPVQKTRPR